MSEMPGPDLFRDGEGRMDIFPQIDDFFRLEMILICKGDFRNVLGRIEKQVTGARNGFCDRLITEINVACEDLQRAQVAGEAVENLPVSLDDAIANLQKLSAEIRAKKSS